MLEKKFVSVEKIVFSRKVTLKTGLSNILRLKKDYGDCSNLIDGANI